MRIPSIFTSLLLSTSILVAQQPSAPDRAQQLAQRLDQAAQAAQTRAIASCPVRFSVDRNSEGALIQADGRALAHHGPRLNITLENSQTRIASADLVAYGYPAGAHIFPATPSVPQEVSETFHITAGAGLPLVESPVWTDRLAVVNRLEITRIDYADGTSWQPSAYSHCTASPSLFVLVNATAR